MPPEGLLEGISVPPGATRLPKASEAKVFKVTTTADTGQGSLRQAIFDADTNVGPDVIAFNISGNGPITLRPLSKFPNIIDPVTIDGTTQPGYTGQPLIELDMESAGANDAFDLFAGGCTIRGLVINRATNGTAIVIWSGDGNVSEGNYIGTDVTGNVALGNQGNGIIANSANNRIGGITTGSRNLISGTGYPAVVLQGPLASGNLVQGNFIGTNVAASIPLGSSHNGILIAAGATFDTVGGSAIARNVISGSVFGPGVVIVGPATKKNVVSGNYIGTDYPGTQPIANAGNGIYILHADSNTIGGSSPGLRNIISGNSNPGIFLDTSSSYNTIQNNLIGADATGTRAIPNSKGIVVNEATGNLIGGTDPGTGNVISGNLQSGIEIRGASASGNRIEGNVIGLNEAATDTLPNFATGVFVNGASHTLIGGGGPGAGNVIGGNRAHGVSIIGATASGNAVAGNFIGTDQASFRKIGNGGNGVYLDAAVDTVGYAAPNVIAHNGGSGVAVSSGTGHLILDNSIFDNGGLGIDLFPPALTVNDTLDADTGANGLQNFPLLDSTRAGTDKLTIIGHINSAPNAMYRLDFYSQDSAGHTHFGEGRHHLDSVYVSTGPTGRGNFAAAVRLPPSGDQFISATATDFSGNTSEFSQCFGLADADGDGIPDFWETQGWGIDVNSDGKIDLDLYMLGARPDHKDLFVEADAMLGRTPDPAALQDVVNAFAAAPPGLVPNPDTHPGIRLHVQLDDTTLRLAPWSNPAWGSFRGLEDTCFGTRTERADPNARFILAAKRLVFRYCIFADMNTSDSSSGRAESDFPTGCNEFMVTLGLWTPPGGTRTDQAGTFMHELGHTLGLHHGGGDDINYKPNYISVMNYTWQFPFDYSTTTKILSYSPLALPQLNEAALVERKGLDPPDHTFPIMGVPFSGPGRILYHAKLDMNTPVDWDSNRTISTGTNTVDVDLNIFDSGEKVSPHQPLVSHEDWRGLIYNFRNSPGFYTGNVSFPKRTATPDQPEMDLKTYRFLKSIPPPRPSALFRMDGRPDSLATTVTVNHGITVRAAYVNGELYISAPSASGTAGDVYAFVSETPGTLMQGPPSTAGQVATWIAVLASRKGDQSAAWLSPGGDTVRTTAASAVLADTLEGVIDLEYLLTHRPKSIYVAVGVYQNAPGGSLLDQAPAGNGDGNIDIGEFASTDATSPVLLSSFIAKAAPGGGVRLQWTTAAEGSVLGFDIQRRLASEPGFAPVPGSFTTAQGSPIESHSYAYLDSLAGSGDWRYRLRTLDKDSIPTYSSELSILVAGIGGREGLPFSFALHQNYPNPFNPSTTLSYDLASAVHVSLKVYDILGQEVETLIDAIQQPGRYRVPWKPGPSAATGVYFVRIHAGTFVSTRKMLFVR